MVLLVPHLFTKLQREICESSTPKSFSFFDGNQPWMDAEINPDFFLRGQFDKYTTSYRTVFKNYGWKFSERNAMQLHPV